MFGILFRKCATSVYFDFIQDISLNHLFVANSTFAAEKNHQKMFSKQNVVGQIYQKLSPALSTQNFAHNILMLNLNLAALNVDVVVIKQVFYICGDFFFP